jgi:hypothetical protein
MKNKLKKLVKGNLAFFKELTDKYKNNDDLGCLIRIVTLDEWDKIK